MPTGMGTGALPRSTVLLDLEWSPHLQNRMVAPENAVDIVHGNLRAINGALTSKGQGRAIFDFWKKQLSTTQTRIVTNIPQTTSVVSQLHSQAKQQAYSRHAELTCD